MLSVADGYHGAIDPGPTMAQLGIAMAAAIVLHSLGSSVSCQRAPALLECDPGIGRCGPASHYLFTCRSHASVAALNPGSPDNGRCNPIGWKRQQTRP
jgi:hypothetical protein